MFKSIIIVLAFSISSAYAGNAYEPYTSLLGFKLEETNLYKIINKLGHTTIKHTGDAADSYYGICYISKENNITVYFESGEMGGGEHTLLSFVVKNKIEKTQECGILKINPDELKLGGIKLGEKIDTVKQALPQPVKVIGKNLLHKHFGKLPFTKKDIERTKVKDMKYAFWDVSIFIEVFENNSVVSGYKVSQVTSW